MKWFFLCWSYVMVFLAGIHFAEWSAHEDHATARAAGRWLRSWFI